MNNLFDSTRSYISPAFLKAAADQLGESENGISKGIAGLLPTLLAGILNKADESETMQHLFNLVKNFDTGILNRLENELNQPEADAKAVQDQLLGTLFGDKLSAVYNLIAAFAGIKPASAARLMEVAGPMTLGLLAQQVQTENLNLPSLLTWLRSQKETVLGLLPAELSAILGLNGWTEPDTGHEETPAGTRRWSYVILTVLLLGLAIMYFIRACNN